MAKFGWYSVKQAKIAGTIRYTTPEGSEVEISEVTDTKECYSKWDDMAFVGMVDKPICHTRTWGEFGDPMDLHGDSDEEVMEDLDKLGKILEKNLREEEVAKDPKRWN